MLTLPPFATVQPQPAASPLLAAASPSINTELDPDDIA